MPDEAPKYEYIFRFEYNNNPIKSLGKNWFGECRVYHIFADEVIEAWEIMRGFKPIWKDAVDKGLGMLTLLSEKNVNKPRSNINCRGEYKENDDLVLWLSWNKNSHNYQSWGETIQEPRRVCFDKKDIHTLFTTNKYILSGYRTSLSKKYVERVWWSKEEWAEFRKINY